MSYNILKFDVKKMKLEVNNVEDVAELFDESVVLEKGKFWINKNGEGIELRFIQKDNRYILEHIDSYGSYSGNFQEQIEELFKKHKGQLIVKRTWEDGERDTLKIK